MAFKRLAFKLCRQKRYTNLSIDRNQIWMKIHLWDQKVNKFHWIHKSSFPQSNAEIKSFLCIHRKAHTMDLLKREHLLSHGFCIGENQPRSVSGGNYSSSFLLKFRSVFVFSWNFEKKSLWKERNFQFIWKIHWKCVHCSLLF